MIKFFQKTYLALTFMPAMTLSQGVLEITASTEGVN